MTNPVIENIRRSLGRTASGLTAEKPAILSPRSAQPLDKEIEQFLQEIAALQGVGRQMEPAAVGEALNALVSERGVHKAVLWDTPFLKKLDVGGQLQGWGVELVPPDADKYQLAQCDLGVTEADFLLAETGTVVLRSSREKPRAVSLLPPAHLVIASPQAFRPDLQQVFDEAKHDPYLVFVTGASRTSDIELVSTLGVHGPRYFHVWLVRG